MIEFKIGKLGRAYSYRKLFNDVYFDSVANIESSFEFLVDGKSVLMEENWNLVEFTQQLVKWRKKGLMLDFYYFCMDTEEEDIFTFQQMNDGYKFISSWAKASSERVLLKDEVIQFIDRIRIATIERVQEELQVNLREINQLELE